jgi:protein TonB
MNFQFNLGRVAVRLAISIVTIVLFSISLAADETRRLTAAEALAAVVSKVVPDYPAIARQMKLSGSVELEATIDEEGGVQGVTTVKGNPILAKSAIDALKRWKFKPTKSEGKAVKAVANFTISFKE